MQVMIALLFYAMSCFGLACSMLLWRRVLLNRVAEESADQAAAAAVGEAGENAHAFAMHPRKESGVGGGGGDAAGKGSHRQRSTAAVGAAAGAGTAGRRLRGSGDEEDDGNDDGGVLANALHLGAYVFFWYGLSVSFTMLNKFTLYQWHGGFSFPVTVTAMHFIVSFAMTRAWVSCCNQTDTPPPLPWTVNLRVAAPIGIVTAIEVAADNLSLLYISVTFYTIVKAVAVLFVLLWSVILELEKPTIRLVLVIVAISVGVMLASYGELAFNGVGFTYVLSAAALGGLRWALVQFLSQQVPQARSTFNVLYYTAPWSAFAITPAAIAMDFVPSLLSGSDESSTIWNSVFFQHATLFWQLASLVLLMSFLSFYFIFAEVQVVHLTSSLTLSVLGHLKQMIQIGMAIVIFQDHLTVLNIAGLTLTLTASLLYKYVREQDQKDNSIQLAYDAVGGQPHEHDRLLTTPI